MPNTFAFALSSHSLNSSMHGSSFGGSRSSEILIEGEGGREEGKRCKCVKNNYMVLKAYGLFLLLVFWWSSDFGEIGDDLLRVFGLASAGFTGDQHRLVFFV